MPKIQTVEGRNPVDMSWAVIVSSATRSESISCHQVHTAKHILLGTILFSLFTMLGAVLCNTAKAPTIQPSIKREHIRLLIWQEYLSLTVREHLLQKHGFEIEETSYLSSELAMSRLLNGLDQFDVAVISNLALPVVAKSGRIVNLSISDLAKKGRRYLPMFDPVQGRCLPFFWSVTGYMYDTSVVHEEPNSILKLLSLSRNPAVHVGLLDDPLEISQRVIWDHDGTFANLKKYPREVWKNSRFLVDIPSVYPKHGIAIYTWHGIAADYLRQNRALKFALPANNLLISYDVACIVNNDKARYPELSRFVEALTHPFSMEENIRYNQIFRHMWLPLIPTWIR